jgi:hypothetical protein
LYHNILIMIALFKEDWSSDPKLKHWSKLSCVQDTRCGCKEPALVELWDHDTCVRGRIDTIVCTNCNKIKSFKIVR